MKLTRRIVTLALTLVLLAGVLTVPTFAAGYQMYGIGFVTATSLRLRQEPNTTSKILATAPRDECVVIISKVGQWYKVNYNLQEGYMHADYLNVKTARNAELGYGKVTGSSVNLRSGPGTSYAVVGSVKKGDTSCYIIGLNNGWYKVITGSKICYIRSDYLELTQIPYENKASSNSPKFFRLGNSTGVAPSPEALNGSSGSANNSSAPQPSASGSQILQKPSNIWAHPMPTAGPAPAALTAPALCPMFLRSWVTPLTVHRRISIKWAPPFPRAIFSPGILFSSQTPTPAVSPMWAFTRETGSSSTPPIPVPWSPTPALQAATGRTTTTAQGE